MVNAISYMFAELVISGMCKMLQQIYEYRGNSDEVHKKQSEFTYETNFFQL